MRIEAAIWVLTVVSACDLGRDLDPARFACGRGGSCDDMDAGSRSLDADSPDLGSGEMAPMCDPGFTPCGGMLPGNYRYQAACSQGYAFNSFLTGCMATGMKQTIRVMGTSGDAATLSVGAADLSADCLVTFDETILVPDLCANAVGGCTALGTYLSAGGFSNAHCAPAAGGSGCLCSTSGSAGCIASGLYTSSGTQLMDNGTYDYCAKGGALVYGAAEPDTFGHRFVFVLEPR